MIQFSFANIFSYFLKDQKVSKKPLVSEAKATTLFPLISRPACQSSMADRQYWPFRVCLIPKFHLPLFAKITRLDDELKIPPPYKSIS
jgi:hypothetical protein